MLVEGEGEAVLLDVTRHFGPLLTHIGRSVPAHRELKREAAQLCEHALPAYDGMTYELREA
jgi:hypothetical protein